MRNIVYKIGDFIVYGNVFIAACAALQAWQTIHLRHYSVDGHPHIIFIFVATFFLYNIHKPLTFFLKKQDFQEIAAHDKRTEERLLKSKAFEAPLSILIFIAGMTTLECYLRFHIDSQWQIVGAGTVSIAYVLPIWKGKRLRDIPYIKIFMIAGVWTFVTVIFPLKAFAKVWYSCDTFIIFERFTFLLALTLPFDIRDRAWDKKTGVKTIPLSIGIARTQKLAYALLGISYLLTLFIYSMTVYPLYYLISTTIVLILSAYCISLSHKKQNDYFYYVALDGMLFLQSVPVVLHFLLNRY